MKPITKIAAVCLMFAAGAAVAADGVTNPTVKARMDVMQAQRAAVGALGGMASGQAAFDAEKAQAAKAALIAAANDIAPKFQPQGNDPVSKAKPEIWSNWDDFVVKASALVAAAEGLDASSLDGVKAGMGAIGPTCQSCHGAYRN